MVLPRGNALDQAQRLKCGADRSLHRPEELAYLKRGEARRDEGDASEAGRCEGDVSEAGRCEGDASEAGRCVGDASEAGWV